MMCCVASTQRVSPSRAGKSREIAVKRRGTTPFSPRGKGRGGLGYLPLSKNFPTQKKFQNLPRMANRPATPCLKGPATPWAPVTERLVKIVPPYIRGPGDFLGSRFDVIGEDAASDDAGRSGCALS